MYGLPEIATIGAGMHDNFAFKYISSSASQPAVLRMAS
jgi:hypothetical protein